MTDEAIPEGLTEVPQPLEYLEPTDMNVILGMVPNEEGLAKPTLFLQVVVPDKDGEPVKTNYAMGAWDSIRAGLTMATMAVTMTEAMADMASGEKAGEKKRAPSPYV